MSRLFDGSDDQMVYAFSGTLFQGGAKTLMMVLRIIETVDNNKWLSFIECETSGGSIALALGRENSSPGLIYCVRGGGQHQAISVTDADSWMVVGWTIPSGTATPRFHKDVIGGSPTHTAGGGTQSDNNNEIANVRIGGNDDFANIRVAAAAIFNSEISDGNWETIEAARTTQAIADLTPVWLVDDSDAFATNLINPGVGDRSSITGTADDADDPASWVYGLGGAGGTEKTGIGRIGP